MADLLMRCRTDETFRNRMFPVTRERTYLAHAAVTPLPAPVADAVCTHVARVQRDGQFTFVAPDLIGCARELAARLLGVTADEIAFTPSTSAALSLVAEGLPWRAGDHVIIPGGEFPSVTLPFTRLRERGVDLTELPYRDQPLVEDDVLAALRPGTRLVVLTTAHFVTGRPVADLPALAGSLRQRGVLVAVDAIQTLGAMPIDASSVDFLAAGGHKWLLAPQGMGMLYVRREHLDRLRPALLGWHSLADPHSYDDFRPLAATAQRFEPGTLNVLGLVGLRAALELLQRAGIGAIGARLAELRRTLVAGLVVRGYQVPGAECPQWTGITAFRRADTDPHVLAARLLDNRVVASVRARPGGRSYVRLAPHFYTTDADLARLWEAL